MSRTKESFPFIGGRVHEHELEHRGSVLTLNANWVEERTPEQLEAYIAAVVAVAGRTDLSEREIANSLKKDLDVVDVHLPDLSYGWGAEILRNASRVEIITDQGRLLYSTVAHDGNEIVNREPELLAGEDPEDPRRPFIA